MTDLDRRGVVMAALAAAGVFTNDADAAPADAASLPWIKRIFHLYTGPDGRTRIEQVPVPKPAAEDSQWLLRRTAERVTLGSMAPNYAIDFHVANQPTLLIPLFGSIIVGLADGSFHEFGHGDMAFAEDCTGQGHISKAGAQGCFTVQIQLPKARCPEPGRSDLSTFWREPA